MSTTRQSPSYGDQQHLGYMSEENSRSYVMMNDVPLNTNNVQDQQIVYISAPMNFIPVNHQQSHAYPQQIMNSQMISQHSLTKEQQQNQLYYQVLQQPVLHSNTNQQQVLSSSTYQPIVNGTIPPATSMNNPAVSSTPLASQTKRGRNDTSGLSDSNVQMRPQLPQRTRVFNSSNMSVKRHRGLDHLNYGVDQEHPTQDSPYQLNKEDQVTGNSNEPQLSAAACRFAATRFPFSPFTVIFTEQVREKMVVDDLIKHACSNHNFELKTIAYRRGYSDNNEIRILIFVENCESFTFLYNNDNWPTTLANQSFTKKSPSIPPQLALVLPAVSLQIEWEEFAEEVKTNYQDIVNVIRLKNKAQQPVRAVKLEFISSKARREVMESGEINAMHMKFKVVEYFSQANVLICSNCFGIGHFRKNCPQKEESTCKTCGEKCLNLKNHQCSETLKCVHCDGPHASNDTKCKVIKDYRAALTRNLLSKEISAKVGGTQLQLRQAPAYGGISNSMTNRQTYSATTQMMAPNMNALMMEKIDHILQESTATRRYLEELKEDLQNKYEETKKQVVMLETKVINTEKRFEQLFSQVHSIIGNMCTHLHNPDGSKSEQWKKYWRDQIQTLEQANSSLSSAGNG